MAWKIVHVQLDQRVSFPDRGSARRYAGRYGGLERWRVEPARPAGLRAPLVTRR